MLAQISNTKKLCVDVLAALCDRISCFNFVSCVFFPGVWFWLSVMSFPLCGVAVMALLRCASVIPAFVALSLRLLLSNPVHWIAVTALRRCDSSPSCDLTLPVCPWVVSVPVCPCARVPVSGSVLVCPCARVPVTGLCVPVCPWVVSVPVCPCARWPVSGPFSHNPKGVCSHRSKSEWISHPKLQVPCPPP